MALMITEDCANCDACPPDCPNDAISEGEDIYVIDALKCTECVGHFDEPQCQLMCEPECIIQNPDFQESPDELMSKYEAMHG